MYLSSFTIQLAGFLLVCLSVALFFFLYLCVCVCVCIYLPTSLCLSLCLSSNVSIYFTLLPSFFWGYLSIYLSTYLSYLSINLGSQPVADLASVDPATRWPRDRSEQDRSDVAASRSGELSTNAKSRNVPQRAALV